MTKNATIHDELINYLARYDVRQRATRAESRDHTDTAPE